MPALFMVFDNILCHSLGHPMIYGATEAVARDIIEGLKRRLDEGLTDTITQEQRRQLEQGKTVDKSVATKEEGPSWKV